MNLIKYNVLINDYIENRSIEVFENCNGFTAINSGETDCIVNGVLLHKGSSTSMGESITFGGNINEIYCGRIDIAFQGPYSNPKLTIIQKIYL